MTTSETMVDLQSFVKDQAIRSLIAGMGFALLIMPFASVIGSLSLLYGVLIGIANSYLLSFWVRGMEGKDEKRAKKAVRGSMAVRFTMIACAVSIGAGLAKMNILAFIFGFFIIQVLGTVRTYKDNLSRYGNK